MKGLKMSLTIKNSLSFTRILYFIPFRFNLATSLSRLLEHNFFPLGKSENTLNYELMYCTAYKINLYNAQNQSCTHQTLYITVGCV